MLTHPHMTQPINFDIKVNNLVIKRVDTIKFLGIIIDNRLTWKPHLENIINKISKFTGIFYRIKNCCNVDCLILMYYSLVYPNLMYCSALWGGAYKTYIDKLFVSQKKLIRVITDSNRYDHTAPLFLKHNLLKVHDIISYQTLVFVYKALKIYETDCGFQRHIPVNIQTRNASDLTIPLYKTSHAQQCVLYRGTKLWNNIVSDTKNKSLNTFKIHVKKQLKSSY